MDRGPARAPAAHRRARRRQATRADRDPLAGGVNASAVIVSHTHPPALRGRRAGGRDIAAEADEHAAARRVGGRRRGVIGSERLCGRPKVETDTPAEGDRARVEVDPNRAPTRERGKRQRPLGRRWPTRGLTIQTQFKISVITERDQGLTQRRVYITVGELGRPHARGDRLQQQPRDADRSATGAIERRQLRVLAKARARQVKGIDGDPDGVDGVRKPITIGRHHHRRASERRKPGGSGQEPPETGAGGRKGGAGGRFGSAAAAGGGGGGGGGEGGRAREGGGAGGGGVWRGGPGGGRNGRRRGTKGGGTGGWGEGGGGGGDTPGGEGGGPGGTNPGGAAARMPPGGAPTGAAAGAWRWGWGGRGGGAAGAEAGVSPGGEARGGGWGKRGRQRFRGADRKRGAEGARPPGPGWGARSRPGAHLPAHGGGGRPPGENCNFGDGGDNRANAASRVSWAVARSGRGPG